MMEPVDVTDVLDLKVSCAIKGGKLLTTITMNARISGDDLSKLIKMQERKVPMFATIGTNQLEME